MLSPTYNHACTLHHFNNKLYVSITTFRTGMKTREDINIQQRWRQTQELFYDSSLSAYVRMNNYNVGLCLSISKADHQTKLLGCGTCHGLKNSQPPISCPSEF